MEDFVPHEVAVKLKQKGFDYPCLFVYNKEQIINPEVVKAFGELSDDGYYELTKEGGGRLDWNFVYIYKHQLIPYRDVLIEREIIKAPTISQVMKWLREEKKIHISIDICDDGWFFDITYFYKSDTGVYEIELPYKSSNATPNYDSYEQAVLTGIEYVLYYLI